MDGERLWLKILEAVEDLLSKERRPGATVQEAWHARSEPPCVTGGRNRLCVRDVES
jgi:hypothetical protein